MAKSNKHSGFISAANEKIQSIFENQANAAAQATQAEGAIADPYANLSKEDKFALEAAVVNGYPDTSPYAQSAYNAYAGLLRTAEDAAVKNHYKPNTEEYDDFIQRYIAAMWPDDQILGADQTKNMYDLYTANMQQQEREKHIAPYRDMNQFGNSAAGLTSSEIHDAKLKNQNNGTIFTGEGLFSGYGQSGKGIGQRFGEANQAASQITPPWQKEPGIG